MFCAYNTLSETVQKFYSLDSVIVDWLYFLMRKLRESVCGCGLIV